MNLVRDRCPFWRLVGRLATVVVKAWIGFLVLLLWYGRCPPGLAVTAAMVKAGATREVVFIVTPKVSVLS